MSQNSAIEWTDATWNPIRARLPEEMKLFQHKGLKILPAGTWGYHCEPVSPGCKNCYMFTAQSRYGRDPHVVTRTGTWNDPIKWNREATAQEMVFTCSWSDWFHDDADDWRYEAWDVIRRTPKLTYQILTKRPERIAEHLPADWGSGYPNVWLGVSVEDRRFGLPRIDILRPIPAAIRFLSIEPLLEDLGEINLEGIQWAIVGGESGPGFRPMNQQWARNIRAQCKQSGTAFFFKQSAAPRTEMGIELDGEVVREFPNRKIELLK